MVVRVVKVRSRLHGGEFIVVDVPVLDRLLSDTRRAVHDVRQNEPVPVYSRALGQTVGYVNAYALTLAEVQSRTGDLAVEGIRIDSHGWQDRPTNDHRVKVEHLDTLLARATMPRASVSAERPATAASCTHVASDCMW